MKIAVITDVFLESQKELFRRGSVIQLFNLIKGCQKQYGVDFSVYQMGVVNQVCVYKGIEINILKCDSLSEYIDILKKKKIDCDVVHFNNVDCYFDCGSRISTATIHTNAFLENNKTLLFDIARTIDKLIVVNKEYLSVYQKINNMADVPNGIDVNFFNSNKKRKKYNKKVFFPNIPTDKKNSKFAYDLMRRLGEDYKLYIPENKFETDLNIKFLGRGISKKKMRKMYRKCYYVIVPSLSESCSLCSLEAMAMKNYLIANDVVGIRDYVIHDLKNINDMSAWVNCIKKVDVNLVDGYIKENYQNLIKNYTIDIMVRKYYEIWEGEVRKSEGSCNK